jgi:glycosyltransferase involved in cell wall biosynthesis
MKISVVTISFNQRQFLREAIDSVLNQVGVEIEYIVVDPGSTDGSRELIQSYGTRIAHAVFEKDSGPADGLNRGLELATGDLFYYLNSDDVVLPNALSIAARYFRDDPTLSVVYGRGRIIDEHGKSTRTFIPVRMGARRYAYGTAVILQQSAVIRTQDLRDVGGFNVENRTCWDGEAFLELAIAGKRFRRIREELGLFRIYGDSITGSGRLREAYLRDHDRMFRRAMGREWSGWPDWLVKKAYYLGSHLMDPERLILTAAFKAGLRTGGAT